MHSWPEIFISLLQILAVWDSMKKAPLMDVCWKQWCVIEFLARLYWEWWWLSRKIYSGTQKVTRLNGTTLVFIILWVKKLIRVYFLEWPSYDKVHSGCPYTTIVHCWRLCKKINSEAQKVARFNRTNPVFVVLQCFWV